LVLAIKEERMGFLNLFAVIKTSFFSFRGKYRYCPEMLLTEGKRIGKSRKRNILDDTFGRNSFTLLLGPVVVAVVGEMITVWGLLFAQCILGHCHVLSLDLGKFEVAWEVGWNCCEVVTRMSPTTNTGVF